MFHTHLDLALCTNLTNSPYFVIFPAMYVLNSRQALHGIMPSSSDSSLYGL
jgi:hypothetical protein